MKTRPPSPARTYRVEPDVTAIEVSRRNPDLFLIDDHHARSTQNSVRILGTVLTMVVSDGLSAAWKLHLVEPESADSQLVADALSNWLAAG